MVLAGKDGFGFFDFGSFFRAFGEADSELDAKHEGTMAVVVVVNPEFGVRRRW